MANSPHAAPQIGQDVKHRRPVQIHGVAFPNDVGRQVEVEAVGGKQPKQAVSDVVAGDEDDRGLDPGLGKSRLLEADDVRIVDLEIGDARGLLAYATSVEAGPEDDHLPAAVAELRIEVIVVIARPELDALPARRKTRRYALRRLPRPLVEKQRNDRIAIERMSFRIFLGAILGHDEGRPGNVLNLGQGVGPCYPP